MTQRGRDGSPANVRITRAGKKASLTVAPLTGEQAKSKPTVSELANNKQKVTTASPSKITGTTNSRRTTRSSSLAASKTVDSEGASTGEVVTPKGDTAKRRRSQRGALTDDSSSALTPSPPEGNRPRVLRSGLSSSSVNPSHSEKRILRSRSQDKYLRTENISDTVPDRNEIIAPLQESSSSPSGSLTSSSSVALAVAPITPRTTEGNYSASTANKTRHAEITSVSSRNESQTAPSSSPPASGDANNTTAISDTSTDLASTISKDTEVGKCESDVNKGSRSGPEEGNLSRESELQKLGAASLGGGNRRLSVEKTSKSISELNRLQQHQQLPVNKRREGEEGQAANNNQGVKREEDKEVLESNTKPSPLLTPTSSSLPLPLSRGDDLIQTVEEEKEEKRRNKEVSGSETQPSPTSTITKLPLPSTVESELALPAAAAKLTISTTLATTTATNTTKSTFTSIQPGSHVTRVSVENEKERDPQLELDVPYCKKPLFLTLKSTLLASTTKTTICTESTVASIQRKDKTGISLLNKKESDPGLDVEVPYCDNPPSSIPGTATTSAPNLPAPSSISNSLSSSFSSSSLLEGSNEQTLKLSAVTSAKHGRVCLEQETPPASVQSSDATTTASSDVIAVREAKTDTMCGPSEDKIMPNSSGESATEDKNVDGTTSNTRSTRSLKTTIATASPATMTIMQTVSPLSHNITATTSTATVEENVDGGASNNRSTVNLTATAKSPASPSTMTITQTLSPLSHKITATTSSATAAIATAKLDLKDTSHVKKLGTPDLGPTLEKEEVTATSCTDFNPSIATTSSQSFHESLLSLPSSSTSSSSSSLLSRPPQTAPSASLVSMPAILLTEEHKLVKISPLQEGDYAVPGTKTLTRTSALKRAALNEGLTVCGSANHNGSDDSASSQSSPNLGIDSPDSFVALPQTGFESSEFEATEDSNSSVHVAINPAYDCKSNINSDCAFENNVLKRQCESLVSENTCDMDYDPHVKSLPKVYYNDDMKGTSSKDFHFGTNVYRNIYGPFDNGYDCTFSVQNKDLDHQLDASSNKIGRSGSGFVSDLLRCTTAIADDHSYCWSISKTQDTESLLRDAHPCDDEISDSSSLDDIPDQQESLSLLKQHTFSKSSNLKVQNQKGKTSSEVAEKNHKNRTNSTTPPNNTVFNLNSTSKFLVDGHEHNSKTFHTFDQRPDDDHKVNGMSTPVKFFDQNSASLTSPKISPLKPSGGLGGRGSLQASPKVGCFRIGTFGSISNLDWDENSDTSSSVGSISLSDKSREKFTYRRKVDFTDKSDKSLLPLGDPSQNGDSGTNQHHTGDIDAKNSSFASMVHILHDHDYCMRTTISPLKSELAKELLSGSKLGSYSMKYSNINPSKSSNSSSNSLTYSSSSSSSSPHSASYTGITPLTTLSSGVEAKRKRNNSTTKLADGCEPLQDPSLGEKTDDPSKISDSEAARINESKLKITGSFQNDYVYFLNKTTRSRRRISHEVLPDKNQARNYNDIVIPHLTDADIEALKRKRQNSSSHAADLPIWKSSHDAPGEFEADSRLINTVLSMENLCTDPGAENLSGMIDSVVVPDNLAANPEKYLTPEEMDILFNAVKEVESTNFIGSYDDEIGKELSPASILDEDQINPCLPGVVDHKDPTDNSNVLVIPTSQTQRIPVSQWSGCNSPADDLTKSEVLTTDNNLLDLENIPYGDINPIIGPGSDKFKSTTLTCSSGSGLQSSDLNTLCANNSNSSLTEDNISSLAKFDLLNNSDLFPDTSVADTSNEGNAPWIVTVTMFWNDLPAIMIDNQPYIRLVDIHKQILPAKDTGILKKRCQLLNLEVLNCTEFQRYFLVQYGRAYNSKSTLVISKDDAKILIGYYVNPPTRIPKGEGCEDEPSSPSKRITKSNGSLVGRIKKHGRLIGSRKHSVHKRNTENQPEKDKLIGEVLEKGSELQLHQEQQQVQQQEQQHPSQEQQHQVQPPTSADLTSRPRPLKRKRERLVLAASLNGKSRLRHKKINFLNLIRGGKGTSSSASPAATSTSSTSSSETLSAANIANTVGKDSTNISIDKSTILSTPEKLVDPKCKTGLKNRISASQKATEVGELNGVAQENGELKDCNGRVGMPSATRDLTGVRGGNQQKKKQRNGNLFSAISTENSSSSRWKNSRNSQGLDGNTKSSHLKKLKSKTVASAATNGDTNSILDNLQSLCPALVVYHEDNIPQGDQRCAMQPGKLFLSLYSAKNAKCIKCTTCAKVFSVDEFILHQHSNPNTSSKLVVVNVPQSLRYRDETNEKHKFLWKSFIAKRELFELEARGVSMVSSPLSRTAGVATKGSVKSPTPAPATLNSAATERNGANQRSSSTYRVSSRKRKQKQFYPIENYDFKSRSAGHVKDSSATTPNQNGQCGGKAQGANTQSGVSPSKKALTLPASGTYPSYSLNVAGSTRSHHGKSGGGSQCENVVTLTNEPELLHFTALENDDEYI